MHMDFTVLIDDLFQSYSRQLEYYQELKVLVQKITGQLAMSRGDLAPVMTLFNTKKKILDDIERERELVKEPAAVWQEHKAKCASHEAAAQLDKVLAETEQAIKLFLESEDQLQTYLEHAMADKRDSR